MTAKDSLLTVIFTCIMRPILLFVCLTALTPVFAQNLYYPPAAGSTWETITPASLDFCPERIDSLYNFLETHNTKSFILLQDGKIVLEKYFGAFQPDSLWYWASAGKSLSAFLVGQAQEEGLLGINDPVSEYLGEGWTTCTPEQESAIKVWNQITMTNGLNDDVPDDNCTDPECLSYLAPAGSRWAYHNAPYHLVHDVIEAASGLTIQQFTKNRLLDRVGMRGYWINHVQYGRARDMARYGLLMLGKGVWNGDTLLHDTAYFNAMIRPSQSLNQSYGYLWWLNGQSTFMLPGVQVQFPGMICPNAPSDMYAALGKNDQKIHVVPSKGWVVVRQGNDAGYVGPGGNSVPVYFDNDIWAYLNALVCTPSATGTAKTAPVSVRVSPTVSAGVWQIEADNAIRKIEMIDVLGQVRSIIPTGQVSSFTLDACDLHQGFWWIKVATDQGVSPAIKVVKAE